MNTSAKEFFSNLLFLFLFDEFVEDSLLNLSLF